MPTRSSTTAPSGRRFLLRPFGLVSYAYDDRWGRMTYRDFFGAVWSPPHPMVVMGMLTALRRSTAAPEDLTK
ncbi:MAG: hypothetical protein ACLRMJ_01190 [Alistipes finegoldii]